MVDFKNCVFYIASQNNFTIADDAIFKDFSDKTTDLHIFSCLYYFMKPLLSIIIILWCISFETNGQTKNSIEVYDKFANKFRYDTNEYASTKNRSWAKNSRTRTFENQGDMHSTYIALNSDSSFVFLSIYEPGEFLSVGTWTKNNDTTLILTWSKEESKAICNNSKVYQKYYKYGMPLPMKIESWSFVMGENKLLPLAKRIRNL